ncbi:hypothetical protein AAG906_010289 [Vitis piasezkii]
MSTFLGNFSCKFSFQFQYRPFSIAWMKKNNALCCMKNRAYGSVPVRYIPKKSYKVEDSKSLKSSEEEKIQDCVRIRASDGGRSYRTTFAWDEKNKIQDKRPMNNLIFDAESESEDAIDCDVRVVDFEFMQEPEDVVKEFRIYQEKDYPELDVSQVSKSKQDAEKLAIELLATRAYTAVELKKKLHGKRVACDITEAVINDFQSRGLINDALYAETFSRSRWSSSSWGPRRIKQALFKKGVSEADAEKAVKLVFKDDGSSGDQESRHGLSNLAMDHLFVQASKQWLRGHDVPRETRKSRIIRWLQYRGFTWAVVSFILKKLESQYPH